MTVTPEDYRSEVENAWCPGCGNFGILEAIKQILVDLQLPPRQVLICSGIGQAPKLPHYLKVNTFNGLHGREVASATAAKMCAPDLTVLVHSGDGGAYGEGGNHLLHAIRRNIDITLVVHDNKTYGLTKGQASPTTEFGTAAKLQPAGLQIAALNPLALAISQSAGFVGQSMSARKDHLVDLMKRAINHRGFSLVNVLQPCVTWDKFHTYAFYKEHCYELNDEHDPRDRNAAFRLATDSGDRIPLGLLYSIDRPPYPEAKRPLRDRVVDPEVATRLLPDFR
jgi:2-oxoglutarate ferredoxin oxidoreductase subunit beta